MAELAHPILGDPLYASGAAADYPRLMLHAETLRFKHPETGVMQSFFRAGAVLGPEPDPAPKVDPNNHGAGQ